MNPNGESEVQYGDLIWRAIRRRRRLAVGLFLLVAVPVVLFALTMAPIYESTGVIWVEEPRIDLFKDLGSQSQLGVILAILGSRSLAASVVDALPPRAYDELLGKGQSADWTAPITKFFERFQGKPAAPTKPRDQVITELLKARMTFQQREKSPIVAVTAAASDPVIAADIATAYIETLQSRTRSFSREEARAVREYLGNQAKQVGGTLREAEDAMYQVERQRGSVRVDERIQHSLQNLGQAERILAEVGLSEDIARTRLAAVKAQLEGRPAGKKVTGPIVVPPSLKVLADRWGKAETSVAALTRRFTDAHPEVRAAKEEAQQAWLKLEPPFRQALKIEISPTLTPGDRAPLIEQALALAQDVAKVSAEREANETRVRSTRAGLGSLSDEQRELARRRQAVDTTKNLYAILTQKSEEAGSRPQEELRNVRALDPPGVPSRPSAEKRYKILLVGVALGLAMALGVPVGLEILDSTIKTEEEAEAVLGWPVLGSVLAMAPRHALANGSRARALPPAPSAAQGERA
jgi:uncharacterized protein involved in exopolysaccharide biosynthesis